MVPTTSMNSQLKVLWDRRRSIASNRSEGARAWARCFLIVGPVVNAVSLAYYAVSGTRDWITYLQGICGTAIAVYVLHLVERYVKQQQNIWTQSEKLAPKIEEQARITIGPMAHALGLDVCKLFLHMSFSSRKGLSMVDSDGQTHIIMPQGYLDMMEDDPDAAKAMMAHELGHAAQQDTNLWLFTTGFSKYIFLLLISSVALNVVCFTLKIALDPEHLPYVPSGLRSSTFLPISPYLFQGLLVGWGVVGSALYSYIAFYTLRRGRRFSEETADMSAALLTSSSALSSIFSNVEDSASEGGFLAIHPSIADRRAKISEYEKLANVPASQALTHQNTPNTIMYGLKIILFGVCSIIVAVIVISSNTASDGILILAVPAILLGIALLFLGCFHILKSLLGRSFY